MLQLDLKQKWQRVSQRLRAELGDDLFTSWFGRMDAEDHSNLRLIVSVPTRFLKSWIENHYVVKLQKIAEAEFGQLDCVLVRVRGQVAAPRRVEVVERMAKARATLQTSSAPLAAAPANFLTQGDRNTQLDSSQTFDSFVVGTSNQLAHAAACRVTDAMHGAPITFNPLFIHSAAGLGKTHLLNAMAHRIRENQPERKVLFLTAERFMYSFIQALRQRDTLVIQGPVPVGRCPADR